MNLLTRNRNFLFLFLGRIVTNIGDSIYYVAAMWLVYDLSGSAFYSGLAGFLTLLPAALQFITGPFVDRWPIKRILVTTQALQFGLILIIPITYYMNALNVAILLIIMPIISFIEQFAYPAQTKALPQILEKQELIKGNSLFAFAYQGVDLIFNAVSGLLVALVGAITLYLVDSVTFAVAALLFALIKIPDVTQEVASNEKSITASIKNYWKDLSEGFSIVFHSLMATFLLGSIFCNFTIGAAQAVLPAFADVQGGAEWYGFYLAAISTGSLVGAIISNWFGKYPVGKLVIGSFIIGGGFWVIGPILSSPFIGVLLFGIAWVPVGATNVMFAAVAQTVIPNRLLGRVNAVSRSMSVIAMPIGSLVGGYAATLLSPTLIFSITGGGILFVAIVWLLHPRLRKLPNVEDMTPKTFLIPGKEKVMKQYLS